MFSSLVLSTHPLARSLARSLIHSLLRAPDANKDWVFDNFFVPFQIKVAVYLQDDFAVKAKSLPTGHF